MSRHVLNFKLKNGGIATESLDGMFFARQPIFSVFRHWELLKGFVSKDIKTRFVGSIGGLAWTVLNPLATIIAYFFVFAIVLRIQIDPVETGTDRFALFFLCGFFPWSLLADSLNKSAGVLIGQSAIITKVVFPVELLPISTVFSTFLINGVGFFLFLLYLASIGYAGVCWFFVPLAMILELLFIVGLCFFLSAVCVFIRDIGELLGIGLMLWFFVTPIIYPISMAPAYLKPLYWLNPIYGFVRFYRKAILMNVFDFQALPIMVFWALISCWLGSWVFMRSRDAFGDVL